MTIHSVKAVLLKATAAAALAGALVVAAPKAQAQQFAVGVQFGTPAYGYNNGPAYGYTDRYAEHRRWEREQAAIARRDAWIEHQRWERRDAWRDRRDFSGYPPRAVPYNRWR